MSRWLRLRHAGARSSARFAVQPMSTAQQAALLQASVSQRRAWRAQNPGGSPSLQGVTLTGNLGGADLLDSECAEGTSRSCCALTPGFLLPGRTVPLSQ